MQDGGAKVVIVTNRCNLLLTRQKGCRHGDDCRCCHLHPVSKKENQARPSKGYDKNERLSKLEGVTAQQREEKNRKLATTSAVSKDFCGIARAGQLQDDVAVSVLTIGRNLDRGFACAKHVEDALGLPPGVVFVLAGLDFRNGGWG